MIEETVIENQTLLDEENYSECVFKRCDLSSADLSKKRFFHCRFEGCNLTAVKLELTRLQEVTFYECKCMGVDFTLCDPQFLHLNFDHCQLRGCNFTEMPLKRIRLTGCQVRECHFVQSDMREGVFTESNFEGSLFHKTRLEKADFREAISYQINPENNPLKGAKFSKLEALSLLEGFGILLE